MILTNANTVSIKNQTRSARNIASGSSFVTVLTKQENAKLKQRMAAKQVVKF